MRDHVRVLAVLHIVFGSLGLVVALACLAFFGVIVGVIQNAAETQDAQIAVPVVGIVGAIIVVLIAVFSLPGIVTGIGLLHHREWARIVGIVLAAISLPGVPFGTAMGIYGLWVLLNAETVRLFAAPPARY